MIMKVKVKKECNLEGEDDDYGKEDDEHMSVVGRMMISKKELENTE